MQKNQIFTKKYYNLIPLFKNKIPNLFISVMLKQSSLAAIQYPIGSTPQIGRPISKGKKIFVNKKGYIVHELNEGSFKNVDYALFFTDASVSSIYILKAIENNVKVIDNSSHFRMNDEVKLIAYGANEDLIDHNDNLISNPNCAVIQSIVPLYTLKSFGIKEIRYNTVTFGI